MTRPLPRSYFRILRIRVLRILFFFRNNSPYISGDSIAELTDYYVFGRNSKRPLNRKRLQESESISVPGHMFHLLLNHLFELPKLKTVVTCNSDQNFSGLVNLPSNISLWLCQNNSMSGDSRVHTLPIGIENIRLARSGFPNLHRPQSKFEIQNRVLVPPMSPTNVIRAQILEELNHNNSYFDIQTEYLKAKRYFSMTRRYRFILALEGNGFENHRIWEALYQNSFPVMLRTKWSLSLAELKLPIMYIDSISDISGNSLETFLQSHGGFQSNQHEALWTPYWKELIESGVFRNPNPGYQIY
jgi:hypothetical protein